MRSVMTNQFTSIPRADIPRSTFDRSHGLKTTFDADFLVPILVDDIIPGDSFNVKCNFFARLATPLEPIMDNMYLDTFFFFVPYRLVWDNWEKFCGSQDDVGDSIDFTIPPVDADTTFNVVTADPIYDYMGLPWKTNVNAALISGLPFRAYYLIWNEWFRNQNLVDKTTVDKGDSAVTAYFILKRAKRADYFTRALPAPQRGAAVQIPIGANATVMTNAAIGADLAVWSTAANDYQELDAGAAQVDVSATTSTFPFSLYADLSTATTSGTINDLRLAYQTQRLLERDARAGTRYVETLLAHWGVTSPDFRLQRPEFLGGGSTPINISPVHQQSAQPTPAPNDKLGNLAAIGTVSGTHGFTKSFVEHGVVIGLCNVRGDITYSQGIDRYWTKQTRFDFFYPVLQHVGEQSILQKEIWTDGVGGNDDLVFGYVPRYEEYRFKPSRLSGLMNVDHASTLAVWHLSEDFSAAPTLGLTFNDSNLGTPLDRAIAIPSEPHFIADFYFEMKCARPMSIHGTPGMTDHF